VLNTLYEVLIYLEDRGEVALDELSGWKKRQVRGALGRLEREGWVIKRKQNGRTFYRLSPNGQREIDRLLSYLRARDRSWDGSWRLVMFDIPEKQRGLRDKLRRALLTLGMGIFQGSVWVSPRDIKKQVFSEAERIGIPKGRLVFFEAEAHDDDSVARAWDLEKLNRSYKDFISDAKKLTKSKETFRFEGKKLIFDYALIISQDPRLPDEFLPRDWAEDDAHKTYQRIRRLIV
jgi:phenylacetic acid degradation operon negative regulatory protein